MGFQSCLLSNVFRLIKCTTHKYPLHRIKGKPVIYITSTEISSAALKRRKMGSYANRLSQLHQHMRPQHLYAHGHMEQGWAPLPMEPALLQTPAPKAPSCIAKADRAACPNGSMTSGTRSCVLVSTSGVVDVCGLCRKAEGLANATS